MQTLITLSVSDRTSPRLAIGVTNAQSDIIPSRRAFEHAGLQSGVLSCPDWRCMNSGGFSLSKCFREVQVIPDLPQCVALST